MSSNPSGDEDGDTVAPKPKTDAFSSTGPTGTSRESDLNLTRESADGRSSGLKRQKANEGRLKQREHENEYHDLDKDIDDMLEYNVKMGQVDPEGSSSIQSIPGSVGSTGRIEDIEVHSREGSVKDENEGLDKNVFTSSERSITSDTDSSVLAESVVRIVMDKAVNIVISEQTLAFDISQEKNSQDTVQDDVKVGLFQYQDFDASDNDDNTVQGDDEDNDISSDENKTDNDNFDGDKKDTMVGLFQYTDLEGRVRSPVVSEVDDVVEDQIESINEEEKENILKLYGLEGMDSMSPKSASPSENNYKEAMKVLDVQREVYEPSTRHFSITRDTSSSDSTPRFAGNGEDIREKPDLGDNGEIVDLIDQEVGEFIDIEIENQRKDSDSSGSLENTEQNDFQQQSSEQNDIQQEITEQDYFKHQNTEQNDLQQQSSDQNDIQLENTEQNDFQQQNLEQNVIQPHLPASISPPLVQYEPVKENGKFRIVKTAKLGGGTEYSAIRVGGDITPPKESPRSNQSPRDSPRESITNGNKIDKGALGEELRKHSSNQESQSPTSGILKEHITAKGNEVKRSVLHPVAKEVAEKDRMNESGELDKEKIRKLLQRENDPVALKESRSYSSSRDSGVPKSHYSGQSGDLDRLSPRQLTLSELQDSSSSRIRYTTRDTSGREVSRTGPVPYNVKEDKDRLASDSRYIDVPPQERPLYDWQRYKSDDSSKTENRDSSRVSSNYEEDLLRSAYSRVSENITESFQSAPVRSHESSAIPGFNTLQDQQAKWSAMFHTLEDEHRRELRSQYERHQYNIQRLQQQMELELQKQHLAIRKKLDIHKEALAKMSPDREQSRRYRSPDRNQSPERLYDRSLSSPKRSKPEMTTDKSDDHLSVKPPSESKTWREIYREVREEEERTPSPTRPLKRSLDTDFENMDNTVDRSRSVVQGSTLSRSGSRERSREVTTDTSLRTPTHATLSKADRDRSLSAEGQRYRSPEGHESRSQERDAAFRTPDFRKAPEEKVSRHVKELLDNLNDSRYSLHDLEENMTLERPSGHLGDTANERPRAGVYSSPMPLMSASSKFSKSTGTPTDHSDLYDSRLTQSLPPSRDRAEFYSDRPATTGGREKSRESNRIDDSYLSPSSRMNLREKHSKHLADLRAYYEDELRELRKALADTIDATAVSVDTSVHSTLQSQLLESENKHLVDKCRSLEDEIEDLHMKVRILEQKTEGLEKRANEYAAAYADSQAMSIQHRAHIEELQRYCRERDELVNDLESKKQSDEDSRKIYKKNLEDEIELHRQDKIALQRMIDRYESLEREYKLLQETMSSTENKLYETRTDVVELNRTISKLELENKRLGRENDNLRHKVTQSLNLSSLHESFGSPSSPREVQSLLKPRSPASGQLDTARNTSQPTDQRMPGFATSLQDFTPAKQTSGSRSAAGNQARPQDFDMSRQLVGSKQKRDSKARRKEEESSKGRQSEKSLGARKIGEGSSLSSSREDVTNRSHKQLPSDVDEQPTRDTTPPRRERTPQRREATPPRPVSPSSQAESDVADYSPLLKAERELFKLRDMMRQAVAVKPTFSPPQPKLQKKFYGSERPSNKDDYTPDLGTPRGRKEKHSSNSQSSVAKTKTNQIPISKSDKALEKSGTKRSGSGKGEKSSSKLRDRVSRRDSGGREREVGMGPDGRERDSGRDPSERQRAKEKDGSLDRENNRLREKSQDTNSSTRFDIDFNEGDRTMSVTPKKSKNLSGKQKNLCNGDAGTQTQEVKQTQTGTNGAEGQGQPGVVENTLDMMRHGQFTSRPEWENLYTSMAKPKTENQDRTKSMEEKVKERILTISEMESRYDGLQVKKRQLESSINKIPLHGRVDRNNRRQKEELEDQLDRVERELGSLRMTLKRYNVLKTVG